jgi:hydrogenase-4 component F
MDVKEIPTLLILGAIPTLLIYFSLFFPDVKLTRKVNTVLHWVQLVLIVILMLPLMKGDHTHYNIAPGLVLDRIGAYFIVLTTAIMSCCVTHADTFFSGEKNKFDSAESWPMRLFYACINLFLFAMTFCFLCDNLGYLWIGIETTTLSSAPLVYFDRTKNALEACWKYLIICSVGIAFALLGTVFIFASSQHGALEGGTLTISELILKAPALNFPLLRLGFIFCLIGYGTKAGVFPLHSWLPDAYSEAPAPASAMLSAALVNCALFGIWRVVQITQATNSHSVTFELVAALGTITVVAASVLLIRQHSFKRMWAYSSIENVGLMLVAIGLGSGGLFLLQAINHSLGKAAVFLLSGNIIQASGTKKLHGLHGVLKSCPLWGGLLAMATFAITGSPPFGSFLSELQILASTADSNHWILAICLIFAICLSFIAICMHVGGVLFGTPRSDFKPFQPLRASIVPAVLICGALVLGTIVHIDFWTNLR